MASHLIDVAKASAQLMRLAKEPRCKMLGIAPELVALAVALNAIAAEFELLRAGVAHAPSCECRACCLTRMVAG